MDLNELRKSLKIWEKKFLEEHERRPNKDDVAAAPPEITETYKNYGNLRKEEAAKQTADVWGDEMCKKKFKANSEKKEKVNTRVVKKNGLSSIGAKLLSKADFSTKTSKVKNSSWKSELVNAAQPPRSPDKDEISAADECEKPFDEFESPVEKPSELKAPPSFSAQSAAEQSVFEKALSFTDFTKPKAIGISSSSKSGQCNRSHWFNKKKTPSEDIDTDDTSDLTAPHAEGGHFDDLSFSTDRASTLMPVPDKTQPFSIKAGNIKKKVLVPKPHSQEIKTNKPNSPYTPRWVVNEQAEKGSPLANIKSQSGHKRKAVDEEDDSGGSQDEVKVGWDNGSQAISLGQDSDGSEKEEEKETKPRAKKRKTITSSASVSGDNFVRLNMKVKKYQRKGGHISGPAYKRMQWKEKMKARSESFGSDKCFKCGGSGHWANKCRGNRNKANPSIESATKSVKDEDFPSYSEAMSMATGVKKSKKTNTTNAGEDGNAAEDGDDIGLSSVDDIEQIRAEYTPPPPPPCMDPLYQPNDDGTLPETPSEVYHTLKQFGFSDFRPGQEQAIMRILCGQSTLVVLSTGAGKSLCYQLAAYMYRQRSPCITIVISPLVSLMEDQVTGLPPGVNGACLHTNMTKAQRERVTDSLKDGDIHFLLVSPEAIASGSVMWMKNLPPVAFACIDEAHCVSEWSHHFRPSYLRICKILKESFGVRCMLGLTATATMVTAASVSQHLGIDDYQVATIRGSPVPPNLCLSVSRDEDKHQALLSLLQGDRFSQCDSIIIYCTRREQTTKIATFIRTCMKNVSQAPEPLPEEKVEGWDGNGDKKKGKKPKKNTKVKKKGGGSLVWHAESYHAGMSAAQRRSVQNRFMCGKLRVVVATVAFGMGLDKPDVRAIIHYSLPKSFEGYVQEIGRAGRDGKPAHCHLFLSSTGQDMSELKRHIHSNTVDRVVVKRLIRTLFPKCKCRDIHRKHRQALQDVAEFETDMEEGSTITNDDVKEMETTSDAPDLTPEGKRLCPGHERAIPIEKSVQDLDMKEEGISTLLCYLELHPKRWIENLPATYTTCTIQCYGGPPELQAAAKRCPPVAVAIALEKKKGVTHTNTSKLDFNVAKISDAMGGDSGPVKRELKLLQWDLLNAINPRRTGIMVEFAELGFHLRSPGDLLDEEVDEVVDFLDNRLQTQEKTELIQLHKFYQTLKGVSHNNVWMCADEFDKRRSDKLKVHMQEYFEKQPMLEEGKVSMLSFSREMDVEEYEKFTEKENCGNIDQLKGDIRSFIHTYGSEHSLNGRAIARIFHGIGSPCFPVPTWGRVRRYWRCHIDTDFNIVRKTATQLLIGYK